MKKRKRLFHQIYPSYLIILIFSLTAVTLYSTQSFKEFFKKTTTQDLMARTYLLHEQTLGFFSSKELTPVEIEKIDSF